MARYFVSEHKGAHTGVSCSRVFPRSFKTCIEVLDDTRKGVITMQQMQRPDCACFLLQDTAVILGREERRLQEEVEVARRQVAQAAHVLQVASP